MLKDHFKSIAQDKKIIDKNDFWLIENNPLTKIGVFPYLGRQISTELEPNKIYQVLRPKEELTREETLKSLELIPLVDEHTMLGNKQGHEPAEKKGIHGVTGTNVQINDPIIGNDLKIYSETLKDEIKSGKKDLSAGYYCDYELSSGEFEGQHYDAIQKNIIFNHIALVDEGRMGRDVRVMDSKITFDSIKDLLNQKEQKMDKEQKPTQDVDKRELIREVMAIAAKPNEDFQGGEEEKIETIAKKLEAMSYNPSESGANDDEEEPCGKPETKDEDPKEGKEKPCEDKDEDKDKDDKPAEEKPVSMDEAVKYFAQRDSLIAKIKPHIGDNANYPSMTIPQIVKYACDKLDLKNSLDTLEGYIKAKTLPTKNAMDSAFEKQGQSAFMTEYLSK